MENESNRQTAGWLALLVIGISLNTVGIALTEVGTLRWVLVGLGLMLLLISVIGLAQSRQG